MLIHGFGRLGAPVAIRAVEIQCADAVSAGNALERDAPVHRFGCVISHVTIVVAYSDRTSGHWVRNLRVGRLTRLSGVGVGKSGLGARREVGLLLIG